MAAPESLQQVSHAALLCSSALAWRQTVIPYLAQGLRQGEHCLYLTALHTPFLISSQLALEGIDAADYEAAGQLRVADSAQAYLPQGDFDPWAVMAHWQRQTEESLNQGWPALRVVADMSWACYRPPGWRLLGEYEERVNDELIERYPLRAICFYDRMMFPPETGDMLARTHELVIRRH